MQSRAPEHRSQEASPSPRCEGNARGRPSVPLLGPVPTASLNPALRSGDSSWVGEESYPTQRFILQCQRLPDQLSPRTGLCVTPQPLPRRQRCSRCTSAPSPPLRGQGKVSVANRKPQPCCSTQGRRLGLRPGALPSSRDYKRLYPMVPEPAPVLDVDKVWTALEGSRANSASCLLSWMRGPLPGQARVLAGTCSPPAPFLPVPPSPFPRQVSGPPVTHPQLSQSLCSGEVGGQCAGCLSVLYFLSFAPALPRRMLSTRKGIWGKVGLPCLKREGPYLEAGGKGLGSRELAENESQVRPGHLFPHQSGVKQSPYYYCLMVRQQM